MKREKRTLQELTIKDGFLFAAAMMDEENCRLVLERILQMDIEHVEVDTEKSIIYNPDYKSVRLDVYARDEKNTHFDVEMQVENERVLKRSRYYHSQMDMELIDKGEKYETMSDGYVIFICDYDPLGLGKYRYTVRKILKEDESYEYEDGQHTIFLNTHGRNEDEEPEELVKFLKYIGADLKQSTSDYGDALVERLQDSVSKIKKDRKMRERFMTLEELMKKEYNDGYGDGREEGWREGRKEGRAEGREEGREEEGRLMVETIQKLKSGVTEEQLLSEGISQGTIDRAKMCL